MTDVDAALAAIRQEKADREAEAAAAAAAEQARLDAIDAAKAECFQKCGPVSEALAGTVDPAERAALVELEQRTHAEHADALEQAYLTFAGQSTADANLASGETAIESHVTVASETTS